MVTAHDITASPELFNAVVRIREHDWECMGYSKNGRTVKFSRLIPVDGMKVKQINIYVDPETEIELQGAGDLPRR